MLMLALNLWNLLSGRFDASDPFIQLMAEIMGSASAGAILAVLVPLTSRFNNPELQQSLACVLAPSPTEQKTQPERVLS